MVHCSEAFAELTNLINTARWHRENCHENCNVALYVLGLTAQRLLKFCWKSEKELARRLIKENNWTLQHNGN